MSTNILDLHTLLLACGKKPEENLKLYRHAKTNAVGVEIKSVLERGQLQIFQAAQVSRQLGEELVAFFMAEQGRLSRFLGVWRVKGIYDWRHESPEASQARGLEFLRRGDIWHVLESDPRFDELKDRLVIVWPETGRHHQWLVHDGALKRQIAVQEIRALGTQQVFPGFDHIVLDYHAHCALVRSDVSGWREPLSSTRGIYLISESETGDMYIGSAMGAEGIWGRWAAYAQTGHGGNKL